MCFWALRRGLLIVSNFLSFMVQRHFLNSVSFMWQNYSSLGKICTCFVWHVTGQFWTVWSMFEVELLCIQQGERNTPSHDESPVTFLWLFWPIYLGFWTPSTPQNCLCEFNSLKQPLFKTSSSSPGCVCRFGKFHPSLEYRDWHELRDWHATLLIHVHMLLHAYSRLLRVKSHWVQ